MKNCIIYSLLLLFSVLLFSCGDDDEPELPTCAQENYIGTWVGPENCTIGSGNSSLTVTIVAKGADIELDGGSFDTDIVSIDEENCSVSGSNSSLGQSFEYSGSINGDDLFLTHKRMLAGQTVNTCTYTLVRQ